MRAHLTDYKSECDRDAFAPVTIPEEGLTPDEEERLRALGYL
jgi:hypothetical protein